MRKIRWLVWAYAVAEFFLTPSVGLIQSDGAAAQQTIYFQATPNQGGQLSIVTPGSGGGVPYVGANGAANIASTASCRLFATGNVPTGLTATSSLTAQTPVITEVYYAESYV